MKKLILLVTFLSIFSLISFSQVSKDAIGLRLGGSNYASGAEISYQKALNNVNRVELDFGFGFGNSLTALQLSGIYHWDMNIVDGLNWYIGPGASVLMYAGSNFSYLDFGIGGQVGLEYDFNHLDVPILVSIDTRPMIQIRPLFNTNTTYHYQALNFGCALSVRYTF